MSAGFSVPQNEVIDLRGNVLAVDDIIVDDESLLNGDLLDVIVGNSTVLATGSSEPRTLSDRFSDYVNVLDFGVPRDGVTDARAALNTAVEVAIGEGKRLYIPAGDYLIDTIHPDAPYGCGIYAETDIGLEIVCDNNARLIASQNFGNEIEEYLGSGGMVRIQKSGTATIGGRISWTGGSFDITAVTAQDFGTDCLSIGPKFDDVAVDRVWFNHGTSTPIGTELGNGGGDSSLYIKEAEHVSISRCLFVGARDLGIYINADSNLARTGARGLVYANRFYRCQGAMGLKREFRRLKVIGNDIDECGNGIFLGQTDGSTVNNGKRYIIQGNHIYKTVGDPIRAENASHIIVTGNDIVDWRCYLSDGSPTSVASGNIGAGVKLNGVSSFVVTGNNIMFEEWTPPSIANKYVVGVMCGTYAASGDACERGAIVGNNIDNVVAPFRLDPDCLDILCHPNNVTNVDSDAIILNGSATDTARCQTLELMGDEGTGLRWTADGLVSIVGNDAEIARFNNVSNAVNRLQLWNSASGNAVLLQAQGSDTHINLRLSPRGSQGSIEITGIREFPDDATAAANAVPVNGLYRTGSVLKIRVA